MKKTTAGMDPLSLLKKQSLQESAANSGSQNSAASDNIGRPTQSSIGGRDDSSNNRSKPSVLDEIKSRDMQ